MNKANPLSVEKPSVWMIFWSFLTLGCVSFGGPPAHLGYFQRTFVEHKRWLSAHDYAALMALAQVLPGPSSSQVGFGIGLHCGGVKGAVAAFLGFTLPSFVLMAVLGVWGSAWFDDAQFAIHLLMLLSVAIVADAVFNMARQFCQRALTVSLALFSALMMLLFASFWMQLGLILIGALLGRWLLVNSTQNDAQASKIGRVSAFAWAFMIVLGALSLLALINEDLALVNGFYLTGSAAFGGGHVILPLAQQFLHDVPDAVIQGAYTSAQAVPGPMFTMASYLGAKIWADAPFIGAAIATIAIFLPGLLLMLAARPYWQTLVQNPRFAASVSAVNAIVVGFLLAALISPIALTNVTRIADVFIVLFTLAILRFLNINVALLVVGALVAGCLF